MINARPTLQFLIPVFLFLFYQVASSQFTHSNEQILSATDITSPGDIAVGDLDGDGDEDFVYRDSETQKIFWQKQVGPGSFAFAEAIEAPIDFGFTYSLRLAEMDGDGFIDIVLTSVGGTSWMKNMAGTSFEYQGNITSASQSTRDSYVDFNADGLMDIMRLQVFSNVIFQGGYDYDEEDNYFSTIEVLYLENLGGGVWDEYSVFYDDTYNDLTRKDIDVEDIDGDGDLDMVFAYRQENSIKFIKCINNGVDLIPDDEISFSTTDTNYDFELIDLDNDGMKDVFFSSSDWLKVNANATMELMPEFFPDFYFSRWKFADINNDGIEDFLYSGSSGGTGIGYLVGSGASTFSDPVIISDEVPSTYAPINLQNGELSFVIGFQIEGVSLLEKNQNGVYEKERIGRIGVDELAWINYLDLENDGDIDVICARGVEAGLSYFLNDGTNNFGEEVILNSATSNLSGVITYDHNNDGILDLFYYGSEDDESSFFGCLINNGDLTFTQGPAIVYDEFVQQYDIADFDGDNKPDLVVVSDYKIMIHKNVSETVAFENFENIKNISSSAFNLDHIDMDNDGDLDIVVHLSTSFRWFKNSNGLFEEVPSTGVSQFHFPSAFIDMNQDGFPEPVSIRDNQILIYFNDGTGQVFAVESFPVAEDTDHTTLNILDLDNDGRLDYLLSGKQKPIWYKGLDQFSTLVTESRDLFAGYDNSFTQGNILLADLDGDGDVDLVSCDLFQKSVSWFEYLAEIPESSFTFDFFPGYNNCIPDTVQFYNSSIANFAVDEWVWDFGDGNTSNELSPLHIYSDTGTFECTLSVCNDNGCSESSLLTGATVGVAIEPNFSIPENGSIHEALSFIDTTEGITNWSWVFGDGAVSDEQSPTHTYTEAGTYTVELFLTNANFVDCTFSNEQIIVIEGEASAVLQLEPSIQVLPNPFSTYLEILGLPETIAAYELVNATGETVQNGVVFSSKVAIENAIPSGIYFLKLVVSEDVVLVRKLVK